jgi:hypothetical protein
MIDSQVRFWLLFLPRHPVQSRPCLLKRGYYESLLQRARARKCCNIVHIYENPYMSLYPSNQLSQHGLQFLGRRAPRKKWEGW